MPARDSVIVGLILCVLAAAPASAQSPANSANAEPPPQDAPTAIEPRPTQQPSSSVGFAQEFSERLAAGASIAAAEREDRAALAKFYAARQQEPVWVTPTGFTPAAEAAIAEIGRAGDWGLDAAAFQLPAAPTGAGLSRVQQADAEIALSLAILKYARHARGGPAQP